MPSAEQQLRLLKKLVSINSVFPLEAKMVPFVRDYLKSCGFDVKLQEFSHGRYNVVAQKGKRSGSVLLVGHLDTVPPYNYGIRDPFELSEKGDKLMGLGAWDMKAGLSLILACAKECSTSNRGLRIVLSGDEENISEGSWFAQRKGEFKDCSVAIFHEIPDSSGYVVSGKRPPILLGRRGRCVYRFKTSGIGSHGAGTGGVSALSLAIQLVNALETIPMPSGRTGPCRLFTRKFQSESTALSLPTEAVIEADVHYIPPYNPKSFLEYVKQSLQHKTAFPPGCTWEVEIPERKTPYLPAYETDVNHPLVQKFLAVYENYFGECAVSYGLTVADENILSVEGIPIVTLGPMGGEGHSGSEWVSKKDFLLLSEIVPKIVQEMLD